MQEFKHAVEDPIGRAFLMAHLLTGNIEQAERSTMEAIDSWNPGDETEATLLLKVLDAAAKAEIKYAPGGPVYHLPAELQAVLRLEPQPRRCFVLRVLAGLPLEACARLLRLGSRRLGRYTCAAFRCLGAGAASGGDSALPPSWHSRWLWSTRPNVTSSGQAHRHIETDPVAHRRQTAQRRHGRLPGRYGKPRHHRSRRYPVGDCGRRDF
jgi:hypothetical protein